MRAYYDAINAGDYAHAWSLGGNNLGESYTQFAAGFADTLSDTLEVLGESGQAVEVNVTAIHADGSVQVFAGTYTVNDSAITSAHIALFSSLSATAGSGSSVHPGAFCSPVGAVGYTADGTRMLCSSKPSGSEARWRHG